MSFRNSLCWVSSIAIDFTFEDVNVLLILVELYNIDELYKLKVISVAIPYQSLPVKDASLLNVVVSKSTSQKHYGWWGTYSEFVLLIVEKKTSEGK